VPTNRLLLASGALIHDTGLEALEGAWGDLDELLDVHEKDVLLKLIKRRMHAGAEAAQGMLPDVNTTRVRDWLSQLPGVAHGTDDWEHHRHTKVVLDKVVAAGRALASHFRDPLNLRRLATGAPDALPELEDSTYRALQTVTEGIPEGTRSMSCGDPRGNNLADFATAAAMYAAQYGGGGGGGGTVGASVGGDVTGSIAYDPYAAPINVGGYDAGAAGAGDYNVYPYTTGNAYGEVVTVRGGVAAALITTIPPPPSVDSTNMGYQWGGGGAPQYQPGYPAMGGYSGGVAPQQQPQPQQWSYGQEAATSGELPAWAASAAAEGYWGPNGWVEGTATSAGSESGHKSNTGVVVGLSIAGGMVALVALVAAGVAVRRRMSGSGFGSSGSHIAPVFSPAAILHRGKEFITGGGRTPAASQSGGGGLMPAYRRMRAPTGGRSGADAGDTSESELNPLSKGGEGPAADTSAITGGGGDSSAEGGSHSGKRGKGSGGAKVQPTK